MASFCEGRSRLCVYLSVGFLGFGCADPADAPDRGLASVRAPALPPSSTETPGSAPNQVGADDADPTPSGMSAPTSPEQMGGGESQGPSDQEFDERDTATPMMPPETGNEEPRSDTPTEPCMGLDQLGRCNGGVSEWCGPDSTLQRVNCAAMGQSCGWVDDRTGWYCGGDPTGGPGAPDETPEPDVQEMPDLDAEPCGSEFEAEVIELANASRAEEGLEPLECDVDMTIAARLHSQDMCDQGYFSHNSLDGRTPWERMRAQGVRFGRAAENIARGQRTPASVHGSWMNSPGHRANILTRGLRRIGVGHVACGGGPYWTEVFAD